MIEELQNFRLTKNFKLNEILTGDYLTNIIILAACLQEFRDFIDVPVYINSGFRSPRHNKKVGGAAGSYHQELKAVDISWKNFKKTPAIDKKLQELFRFVLWYPGHVHVDIR